MKRIPVKIIEFPDGENMIREVMIDLVDTMELEGDPGTKIEGFRDKYFELVKKAQRLFYGTSEKGEKYQYLPSSLYWNLGELLRKFNKAIENGFEITNYTEAISRDFGLSKDYIYDLLTVVKFFKKNEILDSVPFSYYRALKRKRTDLIKLGLFEQEIKRLNKMGEENKLPGREKYKVEIINIIKESSS